MTEQKCRPTLLIFIAGHADCTIAQVLLTDGFPSINVQPLAERSQSNASIVSGCLLLTEQC